jgi:hypothetical protein
MVMKPIISSLQRYIGTGHQWAKSLTVVVVAVQREDQVLEHDEDIGSIQPGDMIEFAPFVPDDKGGERLSFATSDARPGELVPVGGCWHGPLRYELVASRLRPNVGRG